MGCCCDHLISGFSEAGVHQGALIPAIIATEVSLGGESKRSQPSRGEQDLNPIGGRLLDAVLLRSVELLPTLKLEFIEELTHCIGRNYYYIGAVGRSQLMAIGRHVLQQARPLVFQHGTVRVAGLWTSLIGTVAHSTVLHICLSAIARTLTYSISGWECGVSGGLHEPGAWCSKHAGKRRFICPLLTVRFFRRRLGSTRIILGA